MNRIAVAQKLVKLAKELIGTDFPTQDALDKYLNDHPGADRSFHRVKQKNKLRPLRQSFPWQTHPLKRPNMTYERGRGTRSPYTR